MNLTDISKRLSPATRINYLSKAWSGRISLTREPTLFLLCAVSLPRLRHPLETIASTVIRDRIRAIQSNYYISGHNTFLTHYFLRYSTPISSHLLYLSTQLVALFLSVFS